MSGRDEIREASELTRDDLVAMMVSARVARVWRRPRIARTAIVRVDSVTSTFAGGRVGWWTNA